MNIVEIFQAMRRGELTPEQAHDMIAEICKPNKEVQPNPSLTNHVKTVEKIRLDKRNR